MSFVVLWTSLNEYSEGRNDMANQEHVDKLHEGVKAWNQWREANPKIIPDLREMIFAEASLDGVNFRETNLCKADLGNTSLQQAHLGGAHLEEANLWGANCDGALCAGAFFTKATLARANFAGANLTTVDFKGAMLNYVCFEGATLTNASFEGASLLCGSFKQANLVGVNLQDADLRRVEFDGADISGVKYTAKSTRKNIDNYQGIRVDGCFGDPVFKRFAQDQDYLYTIKRRHPKFWFPVWWWSSQCGQKPAWLAYWALAIIVLFGGIYSVMSWYPIFLKWPDSPSWFTPFYFSIVTFTTLGFGDVTPISLWGEICVTLEVVLGYFALGLLVSVFANLILRRS